MNIRRFPIAAQSVLWLAALLAGSSYVEAGSVGTDHPFAVANGQTMAIVEGEAPWMYRICVSPDAIGVSLKVVHDGSESGVSPGDCIEFEATNIRVTPAGALPDGHRLVGHLHRLD